MGYNKKKKEKERRQKRRTDSWRAKDARIRRASMRKTTPPWRFVEILGKKLSYGGIDAQPASINYSDDTVYLSVFLYRQMIKPGVASGLFADISTTVSPSTTSSWPAGLPARANLEKKVFRSHGAAALLIHRRRRGTRWLYHLISLR